MSITSRAWRHETRAADCWDWITAEDVIRHALAAYTLARKAQAQPPGRRFAESDGTAWASRQSFADDMALVFEMRVKAEGYQLGVCPEWVVDAKQLPPQKAKRPGRQSEALLVKTQLDSSYD